MRDHARMNAYSEDLSKKIVEALGRGTTMSELWRRKLRYASSSSRTDTDLLRNGPIATHQFTRAHRNSRILKIVARIASSCTVPSTSVIVTRMKWERSLVSKGKSVPKGARSDPKKSTMRSTPCFESKSVLST